MNDNEKRLTNERNYWERQAKRLYPHDDSELVQWCWKLQKRVEDLERRIELDTEVRLQVVERRTQTPLDISAEPVFGIGSHGSKGCKHDNTLMHGECECLPIEGFSIGDRVRVKDDCKAYGPTSGRTGPLSSHVGKVGRIVGGELDGYDCWVDIKDGGEARFYFSELERL